MMVHIIQDKQGNDLVGEERDEAKYMINRGLDSIVYNGHRMSVYSSYTKNDVKTTIIDFKAIDG